MACKGPILLLCVNFIHIFLHTAAAQSQYSDHQTQTNQEAALAGPPDSLTAAVLANTVDGAPAGLLFRLDHSILQISEEASPPASLSPLPLQPLQPYPTLPGQLGITSSESHRTEPSSRHFAESAAFPPNPSIIEAAPPSQTGQEASFPTGAPVSLPSGGEGSLSKEYIQGSFTQRSASLEGSRDREAALDTYLRQNLQFQAVTAAGSDSVTAETSSPASQSPAVGTAEFPITAADTHMAASDIGSTGHDVQARSTGGTGSQVLMSQPTSRSSAAIAEPDGTALAAAPLGGALPPATALGSNVKLLTGALRSGVNSHSWTDVARLTHMAFSRKKDKHEKVQGSQSPHTMLEGHGEVASSQDKATLPSSSLSAQAGGKLPPEVLAKADGGTAQPWKSILPVDTPEVQLLGRLAQSEVYSLVLSDFKTETLADGTVMGSGNLTYGMQNGTLLQINALSAPLVPRGVLNYTEFYLRMNIAAVASTVEEFYKKMEDLGVRSYVEEAELVYVDIQGLPYYTALLLECQYEVPTRTWVFAVTFVGEPATAGFFFKATDWGITQNVVTDVCSSAPTLLNTTAGAVCPSYQGWPCLVGRGFQLAFDSVRDLLVPAWQKIAGLNPPRLPDRIICGGHSLGAALAAFCSAFMKEQVPRARNEYVGTACPLLGNEAFQKFFQDGLANSIQLTNSCDPIPAMPFQLTTGFVYLRSPIFMVQTDVGNASSYRALSIQRPPVGIYINYNQHLGSSYLTALQAAIANAPS